MEGLKLSRDEPYTTNVGAFPPAQKPTDCKVKILEPEVYIAPVNTPFDGTLDEPWKKLPSASDSVTVEFEDTSMGKFIARWNELNNLEKLRESMAQVARDLRIKATLAYAFDEEVKRIHRVPDDADAWKKFGVKSVVYHYNDMGYYKITYVIFKDGSVYTPA